MSSEINRHNVQKILDRNTSKRKEAILEDQERQHRLTINRNHMTRTLSEAKKKAMSLETAEKRRIAKQKATAKARALEAAATTATRRYVIACGAVVLVTLLTPFPWYGAMALIPGLAVFPMAYIYRLLVPRGR